MRLRWLFLMLLGGMLLSLWPAASRAQDQAITWQIAPGYNGSFRSGAWLPVAITIANNGADVRGTLSVRFRTGNATLYSQTIDLPRGAQKQVLIPVASDRNQNGRVQADVTLQDGATVLRTERINLNALDLFAPVLGVISDDANALAELSNIRDQNQTAVALLRLNGAALPERAELLQTFDVLLIHRLDPQGLTAAQQTALQSWISSGGQLVVSGDRALLAALGNIVPATAQAVSATSSPAGLGAGTGWKLSDDQAPLGIVRLDPALGSEVVLRGDSQLPLLVRQQRGLGAVTVAAFDLQALRAVGNPADFWPRVLPLRFQQEPAWSTVRSQGGWALQQAINLPALQLPSILGLLGFLLVYILIVGPLNYVVLRRADRREWAYFTIPLVVLLFSGGAYLWGTLGRGQSALVSELSIVRAFGDGTQGNATSYLAVFSPTRRTYDVQLPPNAMISNVQQQWDRQGNGVDVTYTEAAATVPNMLVDVGGVQTLAVDQTVAVPALDAVNNADGTITVRNRSPQQLTDVTLVSGTNSAQRIDTLAPGAEQTVRFTGNAAINTLPFASNDRINRSAVVEQIGQALFQPELNAPVVNQAIESDALPDPAANIMVVAWADQPQVAVMLNGSTANNRGDTMYIWPVQGSR